MGKSTEMRYVRKLHGDRMERDTHDNDDQRRSMRDAAVRERRRAMHFAEHKGLRDNGGSLSVVHNLTH